jgi:hypothetical protein
MMSLRMTMVKWFKSGRIKRFCLALIHLSFVPKGQHDSSQARSAWNRKKKWPGPSGTIDPFP